MVRESCCPPGAFGAVQADPNAVLRGKTVVLENTSSSRQPIPCYQVGAQQPKHLVLVFSDVHGPDTGNHKVFCDRLQSMLGDPYTVWMPDLFRGSPMAPDVGVKTFWVDLWCRLSIIWAEKTRITVPAVKADLEEIIQANMPSSTQSVGMVGFCFGAWVIGRSMMWGNENSKLAAGVLIHPSWRPEGVVTGGGMSKEDLAKATGSIPMLLMPGKQDVDFHKDSPLVQQLASQRNVTVDQLVADLTHMDHGWVSRADSSKDKAMQEAQEQATQQTADFLKKHLEYESRMY